jgi:hypothetical protein
MAMMTTTTNVEEYDKMHFDNIERLGKRGENNIINTCKNNISNYNNRDL